MRLAIIKIEGTLIPKSFGLRLIFSSRQKHTYILCQYFSLSFFKNIWLFTTLTLSQIFFVLCCLFFIPQPVVFPSPCQADCIGLSSGLCKMYLVDEHFCFMCTRSTFLPLALTPALLGNKFIFPLCSSLLLIAIFDPFLFPSLSFHLVFWFPEYVSPNAFYSLKSCLSEANLSLSVPLFFEIVCLLYFINEFLNRKSKLMSL